MRLTLPVVGLVFASCASAPWAAPPAGAGGPTTKATARSTTRPAPATPPGTSPATAGALPHAAAADVRQPTVELEPGKTALGSDVSVLPRVHASGEWLPIEAPLLSLDVAVRVMVNGRSTVAVLDTGAMTTTMSAPMAMRLGLIDDDGPAGVPVTAIDSHGTPTIGMRSVIRQLRIGARRWDNLTVTIIGDQPNLLLIGADVLADVDLTLAADEGLVGIFDPGAGPHDAREVVVPLVRDDRQLIVGASSVARGGGDARFDLLVDTGAWNTSVPTYVGVNAGLPVDLGYAVTTLGVAGEQEARGRFVLDPLRLGSSLAHAGRVLALGSTIERGQGLGLLGNDVLMRFRTTISFHDAQLRLTPMPARGAVRMHGPGGATCTDDDGRAIPCVSVALAPLPVGADPKDDDMHDLCLQVDVDSSYRGQTVEMAITAETPTAVSLFSGGAIRAFVSVDDAGAHHCFRLWRQLEHLGVDANTPLTLRWVRTEGVRFPCDPMKTRCVTFTGPLVKLPTKNG